MSQIYEKWRELDVNPFDIKFKNIKLIKIISYPPAQNDVIECLCEYNKEEIYVIIKIERSKEAGLYIKAAYLKELEKQGIENIPKIIEFGKYNNKDYIVLSKIRGERLSDILKKKVNKEEFLLKYGKMLANIHNIKIQNKKESKKRKINYYPKEDDYANIPEFLKKYINYLKDNEPKFNNDTLIHGDFHYANILWDNNKINGLLDWEYCGYGFKEQDIAWACILRSTQYFMDNVDDIKTFLKGYLEVGNFNKEYFYWCLINGYCHFYLMNLNNKEYIKKLEYLLVNFV